VGGPAKAQTARRRRAKLDLGMDLRLSHLSRNCIIGARYCLDWPSGQQEIIESVGAWDGGLRRYY
jgi:hypothetical protein